MCFGLASVHCRQTWSKALGRISCCLPVPEDIEMMLSACFSWCRSIFKIKNNEEKSKKMEKEEKIFREMFLVCESFSSLICAIGGKQMFVMLKSCTVKSCWSLAMLGEKSTWPAVFSPHPASPPGMLSGFSPLSSPKQSLAICSLHPSLLPLKTSHMPVG